MSIRTKLFMAALLSFVIGIAAASPLLVSTLNVRPYPMLPPGPKPDVSVSVVYANFTARPMADGDAVPAWYPKNESAIALDYGFVVNITNLSDEPAVVDMLWADANQNTTSGPVPLFTNSVSTLGGIYRYAILDGENVNMTWIPSTGMPFAPRPNIPSVPDYPAIPAPNMLEINNTSGEGYWQEGVYTSDTYVNTTLVNTYMFVNGTWMDVTGRVQVPDRELMPNWSSYTPTNNIASCTYLFQGPDMGIDSKTTIAYDSGNGTTITTTGNQQFANATRVEETPVALGSDLVYIYTGPEKFNNIWMPHESRLIMLSGTVIPYGSNVTQYLQKGDVNLVVSGQARYANGFVNDIMTDTSVALSSVQRVQLHASDSGYVYSTLGATSVLQTDPWGMEVFVKPGS